MYDCCCFLPIYKIGLVPSSAVGVKQEPELDLPSNTYLLLLINFMKRTGVNTIHQLLKRAVPSFDPFIWEEKTITPGKGTGKKQKNNRSIPENGKPGFFGKLFLTLEGLKYYN